MPRQTAGHILICIKALGPRGCKDFAQMLEPRPPQIVLGRRGDDDTEGDACTRIGRE